MIEGASGPSHNVADDKSSKSGSVELSSGPAGKMAEDDPGVGTLSLPLRSIESSPED